MLVVPCWLSYADIGAIGVYSTSQPVVTVKKKVEPMAPLKEVLPHKKSIQQTEEEADPLLVIPFDKNHAYYDRQLTQAFRATAADKNKKIYEVMSITPPNTGSRLQGEHREELYENNLQEVVMKMQESGVPLSRIRIKTKTSEDVTSQQVRIIPQTE